MEFINALIFDREIFQDGNKFSIEVGLKVPLDFFVLPIFELAKESSIDMGSVMIKHF